MNLKFRLIIFAVVVIWLVEEVVAPCGLCKDKKDDKDDKEDDKKGKKQGGKVPAPLPPIVYKNLDSVKLGTFGVMIGGMMGSDACNDGKTSLSDASTRCKMIVALLDRLPPYMRKKKCRHVTGGFCKKLPADMQQQGQEQGQEQEQEKEQEQNQKQKGKGKRKEKQDNEEDLKKDKYECTLKTYEYIKCEKRTVGWKVDYSNEIPFKDCVGDVVWDQDRHNDWLRRSNSATGTPSTADNGRPSNFQTGRTNSGKAVSPEKATSPEKKTSAGSATSPGSNKSWKRNWSRK